MSLERLYESNVPIRYVFDESKSNNEELIVLFSNSSFSEYEDTEFYEFQETLDNIDASKLIIFDDFGPDGSYYLGPDLNFEVETSLVSLIINISDYLNITFKDLIAIGINKGGFGALYYGLKYNFKNIIVGTPHVKVFDYIKKHNKKVMDYLVGFKPTKIENEKLNNLIVKQLNKEICSNVYILTGDNKEIESHTSYLEGKLITSRVAYDITKNKSIKKFSDTINEFGQFLSIKLISLIENVRINNLLVQYMPNHLNIGFEGKGYDFSHKADIQLIIKNEDGIKAQYKITNECNIPYTELKKMVVDPEILTLEVAFKFESNNYFTFQLDEKILVSKEVVLKGYSLHHENGMLNMVLDIEKASRIDYAFYIKNNNKTIYKRMYQSEPSVEYLLVEDGEYKVKCFIRDKKTNERLLTFETDTFNYTRAE